MLFTNLQLKSNTLKIISLLFTIIGIIFIMFSNYIGIVLVHITIIAALIFCAVNMKMQYKYLKTKEKTNYAIIILALIIGLFKPNLLMILIGILLMYVSIPQYYKIIKTKDYSDVVTLSVHGLSLSFAIYCFLNANAALNTVIITMGIILTIIGCFSLYEVIIKKPCTSDTEDEENTKLKHFEDTSNM